MAMNDETDLIAEAEAVLGSDDPVLSAGIFGLKDDYVEAGAAMVAGGAVGDVVGDSTTSALGSVAALHMSREVRASEQGVTVRMLVAVTATRIHVLDWKTGSGPTGELRSFDRATTAVQITKFGLSRHLALHDTATGQDLTLTGSTAFYINESKGDKLVLHLLSEPG